MRVLIIEDDENKRDQLAAFMAEAIQPLEMRTARSLQSGLRAVIAGGVDLVLLDVTMPTFDIGPDEDGGRPQPYAGREILQQMDRRGIRIPVIVVTQFDTFGDGESQLTLSELDAQLQLQHPEIYRGATYYNVAITGWREDLQLIIRALPYLESSS